MRDVFKELNANLNYELEVLRLEHDLQLDSLRCRNRRLEDALKKLSELGAKLDRLQRRSRTWEDALEKIAELGHKLDFSAAEFAKSQLAEVRNADNTTTNP